MAQTGTIHLFQSGAEVVEYLDGQATSMKLDRKLRVYVAGYKERPLAEAGALIRGSDVVVIYEAWRLVDDQSRYEWVNL